MDPEDGAKEKGVLPWGTTDLPAYLAGQVRTLYRVWREGTRAAAFHPAQILWFVQWFVRLFLTSRTFGLGTPGAPRGLLVYHPMGMGKTRLAAAVALALLDTKYAPLIVAKHSLHSNMRKTVLEVARLLASGRGESEELAGETANKALERFSFVTADAHNMAEQIARVAQGLPARRSDGKKGARRSSGLAGSLNKRVVIVDEAHNLFRAIINASSDGANARRFYAMAMSAKDVRFLFLTGTPASKDPFELVPCFNMLAGRELLPTDYETFYRLYVDEKRGGVRKDTAGLLANRLIGYVSHVDHSLPQVVEGDEPEPVEEKSPLARMPRDEGTTVIRIEMSPMQFRRYIAIREREEALAAATSGSKGPRVKPGSREAFLAPISAQNMALSLPGREAGAGTYFMESRGAENVDQTALEEAMSAGNPPPQAASPKIANLVKRLEDARGPVVIYSQFAARSGARAIAMYLRAGGYTEWRGHGREGPGPSPIEAVGDAVPPVEKRRYALFTGEVDSESREQLVREWNAPDNTRGGSIFAVIISGAGAEGLDLKYVRDVYILEPYWDRARELQVKHRGIRMGSHAALPEKERTVRTWIFVAVANRAIDAAIPLKSRVEETTVDEAFLARGVRKYQLSEAFRNLLKQASIECIAFNYGNCRVCRPDGAPLYLHATSASEKLDPEADTRMPDPCAPISGHNRRIAAKEVTVPDSPDRYALKEGDPPRVYRFDPTLDAFVEVHASEDAYQKVLDAA